MGQALYRKYRSRNLDEVVGQKPITTALSNALKNNQISHAYLFTGPRGIGKTSVARILAYEINGLEYTGDNLPIDIIEIDAASNRRIDEIRDLREKVRIAPVSAKYKVYIIDEVHMLTKEAFNALLKTLEEPPAHVIFILATTEAHKLPETIISRTQRYSFRSVSVADIIGHLKYIAKKEKIDIDDESIALIASHSEGSLRDAISLLDQIRNSSSSVTAKQVRQSFGLPSAQTISNILKAVSTDDPAEIINLLREANEEGASPTLIAAQLLVDIRLSIIAGKPLLPIDEALTLTQALLLVETSSQPLIQLELVLIGAQISRKNSASVEHQRERLQKIEPPLTISEPVIQQPIPEREELQKLDTADTANNEIWNKVLKLIKEQHDTLYGIIRMAKPEFDQNPPAKVTLGFKFPFHYKRINEARHKQVIADALKELGITECKINCILSSKDKNSITAKADSRPPADVEHIQSPANQIDQVRNIFGNRVEVLS
jgi:DNA polymerase III subunit gamma/tau